MKLSRILLSAAAIASLAACGNLSEVTAEGMPEYKNVNGVEVPQLVWPKINGGQSGTWPNCTR